MTTPVAMNLENVAPLSLQLYATDPAGVAAGQRSVAQWCEAKIEALEEEFALAQAALDTARERKWSLRPHRSALTSAKARLAFYGKVKAAIEAGYVMIPDLDVTLFAVRTKRAEPYDKSLQRYGVKEEPAQSLASGEGRYVDPNPLALTEYVNDKEGKPVKHTFASELSEEIEFPVRFVRPEIIEATDRAMALRIFDEIGYAGPVRGKGDPFIVGKIKRPSGGTWSPRVCFFIAWHFDLRSL